MMKTKRNSNWEMLRIVSMLMIIAHHLALYGAFSFGNNLDSLNSFWILFLEGGGKVGANIFFLLSGYFLVSFQQWNKEKIIKFVGQVWLYSIVIFTIFIIFNLITFERKILMQALFPFTYSTWWFASSYLMLYLIFPFLNILIQNIKKEMYQKLLVVTTICFCIIPTVINRPFQCNAFVWAIYLYLVGGYIRLFLSEYKIRLNKSVPLLILCIGVTYAVTIFLLKIPYSVEVFGLNRKQLYDMQSIAVLVISVLFIFVFREIKIKENKVINVIASTTFGIYLLHENPYIRQILYSDIFCNQAFEESSFLIPYTLCEIGCIFVCGMVIELLRMAFIEKPILILYRKLRNRIVNNN